MKKKKTYVLMVSKVFPVGHPKAGRLTEFATKILKSGVGHQVSVDKDGNTWNIKPLPIMLPDVLPKIHTIRLNYQLWKKRIDKINAGDAILSLRQWTGSPYNRKRDGSKQQEFLRLEKVGIQSVCFDRFVGIFIDDIDSDITLEYLATNDGLHPDDFKQWFRKMKYDEHYAILHFTDFRY